MEDVGKFCGQLAYFMAIWYILWTFGVLDGHFICCTKKTLVTLICYHKPMTIAKIVPVMLHYVKN
jgi:hypothetical protein